MKNIIEINNLSYSYPDGTLVLKNIDLSVTGEESVGIIGPNGAGKSTLLMILDGLIDVKESHITIAGMKLNKENILKIREKIGFLFQDPDDQIFMPTVFDNIAFGLTNKEVPEESIKNKVSEILKYTGLENYEKRLANHLSFGQRKLVSLASVLVMEPDIFLLDEPTSNLDRRERRIIIEFINRLKGQAKIIVSHDYDALQQLCSRIVIIGENKILYSGDNKILKDDEFLKKCKL